MYRELSIDSDCDERNFKEGDLYKVVAVHGAVFELRYGYYDDKDRGDPPDVIYPDFDREPLYTNEGLPFATRMQDACELYIGDRERSEDSVCGECRHFKHFEEWIGVCCHVEKRKNHQN